MQDAIQANNVDALREYFHIHRNRTDELIEGMHPVAYAIHVHQENIDPEILRLLIRHSTASSLMWLDADNDSLVSYILYVPNENELLSIFKTLAKAGYKFDRVYGKDATDLGMYLSVCHSDKQPISTPILRMMSTKQLLTNEADYLLYVASMMPMEELKKVVDEFKRHHIDLASLDLDVMTNIITKSIDNKTMLPKLEYFASFGVRTHPDILKAACKWGRMSIPLLDFLAKQHINLSKKRLSKCLYHIVIDNPIPDLELVRKLCNMGADPTLKWNNRDALSFAIANRNTLLTSTFLPFASMSRIEKAMHEKTNAETKTTIRDHKRLLKYMASATKHREHSPPNMETIHAALMRMNDDTFRSLRTYITASTSPKKSS